MSRAAVAAAAALAALAAAGCGGTKVLDPAQVGALIKGELERQTGARIESVRCPTDVEAKAGASFRCTATAVDGTHAVITVRQTSGEGNLSFDAPLLHSRDVETQIADDLGGGARVTCPELVLVEAGTSFECTAKASGDTAVLEVTFKDDRGNFRYEQKP